MALRLGQARRGRPAPRNAADLVEDLDHRLGGGGASPRRGAAKISAGGASPTRGAPPTPASVVQASAATASRRPRLDRPSSTLWSSLRRRSAAGSRPGAGFRASRCRRPAAAATQVSSVRSSSRIALRRRAVVDGPPRPAGRRAGACSRGPRAAARRRAVGVVEHHGGSNSPRFRQGIVSWGSPSVRLSSTSGWRAVERDRLRHEVAPALGKLARLRAGPRSPAPARRRRAGPDHVGVPDQRLAGVGQVHAAGPRCSSVVPVSFSSAAICWLTADWVKLSASAAAENEPPAPRPP